MLTEKELSMLTAEERAFYGTSGSADKATMESALRSKAQQRAAERGIDLNTPDDAASGSVSDPAAPAATAVQTNYVVGRRIAGAGGVIGWIGLGISVIWLMASLVGLRGISREAWVLETSSATSAIISCLFVVGFAHVARAVFDTADAAKEVVALTRAAVGKR